MPKKSSRYIKRGVSLTKEADRMLDALCKARGETRSLVLRQLIREAHEARGKR